MHLFTCISSSNSLDHCRKECFFFVLPLACITLHILQTSKFLPNVGGEMQANSFVRKSDRTECKCSGVSTLCPSPPFPPFSVPLSLTRSALPFQTGCSFTRALGAGGRHAYRSTLSAEGKGMWATPILWAVSKQPLCNLWLGEVVHGERAACLLSVGLHKCVFQIRVGGHVWLHGHNDFPHIYTLGRRILAFRTVCNATLNQSIFLHQNVSYQTFFHVLPALQ